jgi:hypothetical protein
MRVLSTRIFLQPVDKKRCLAVLPKEEATTTVITGSRGRKTKTPSPRYLRSGTREFREEARVSMLTNCHPTCMRQPVK